MRKLILSGLMLFLLVTITGLPQPVRANTAIPLPNHAASGSDLVDAVNALRAANGLPPYQSNAILMSLAQAHAEYMASIGVSTVHTDAQGRRPYQRALDAGYLVAGDLNQGGWFSENVYGGVGKSPQDAVTAWMGDAPHQGTMLSTTLQDVGAGVAIVGNTYYYCLDTGLSTGGTPVAYTPPPGPPRTPSIVPNTPNADGSIVYTIRPGDTILAIAIAYGLSENDILRLNNLTVDSLIYVGQKLAIRPPFTPTPTLPTSTPTKRPTETLWPTSTATLTETPLLPTQTPAPNISFPAAGGAVIAIALVALLAAGIVAWAGARSRR